MIYRNVEPICKVLPADFTGNVNTDLSAITKALTGDDVVYNIQTEADLPTLFPPYINVNGNAVVVGHSSSNGSFGSTTASIEGQIVSSSFNITSSMDGKLLTATASGTGFKDSVTTRVLEWIPPLTNRVICIGGVMGRSESYPYPTALLSVSNGAEIMVTDQYGRYPESHYNVLMSRLFGQTTFYGYLKMNEATSADVSYEVRKRSDQSIYSLGKYYFDVESPFHDWDDVVTHLYYYELYDLTDGVLYTGYGDFTIHLLPQHEYRISSVNTRS